MTTRREFVMKLSSLGVGGIAASAAAHSNHKRSDAPPRDPFDEHDALGLASLVRAKKVSPTELLNFALARVARVNDKINAVPMLHLEASRAQVAAGVPMGPFAGVPMLLKDLHVYLKGTPTTHGSRFFKGQIAEFDSTVTANMKRAGFVIFGKTASPELGLTGTTEGKLHGDTRNPWDLTRTTGGSSGGAAAVVAARALPMAHATDGAGSIRTPGACCGVFGLKPTRARVPTGPDRFESWSGLGVQFAHSISVRDSAALLDALSQPLPGRPYYAPPQNGRFLDALHAKPRKLRIALVMSPLSGAPVEAEVQDAVRDVARLCESLGHAIEEAKLPVDFAATNAAMLAVLSVETQRAVEARARFLGREPGPDDLEPVTARLVAMGRNYNGAAHADARTAFDRAGFVMAEFMERYDVILSPTLAQVPVKLGLLGLSPADFNEYVKNVTAFGPFCAVYNMTGQPAMTVPLSWSRENLPIGSMFAARYGDEATLLNLARQLERARPWSRRVPPVHA